MARSIKHWFFFSQPPETVWDYLTKPELLAQWLMENDFRPVLGLEFQFRTDPISTLDFDGIFYCKVLEIVPFKKLSYSWKSGPGNAEITLDSIVVWNLKKKSKGTELLLEHSGFEKNENFDFYKGLSGGWLEKLRKIEKLLNAAQHDTTNA